MCSNGETQFMTARLWSIWLRAIARNIVFRGILAIAVLAICVSSFAQQPTLEKIRILCLARPLPVMIAESRGILAKYGIEAEFLVRPSSESLRNDLAAGKGDVAFLAVDNDVAMVDS